MSYTFEPALRRANLNITLTPEGLRKAATEMEADGNLIPANAEVVSVESEPQRMSYMQEYAIAPTICVNYQWEEKL